MQENTNKAWVIRLADIAQQLWRMSNNTTRLTLLQAEPKTNIRDGVSEVSLALAHLRETGYIDEGTADYIVKHMKADIFAQITPLQQKLNHTFGKGIL